MADQEAQINRLSQREEMLLLLISQDHNYQAIGQILQIQPITAHRFGSQAREHFAKLQNIPLETLCLEKYKYDHARSPQIGDAERERLHIYFESIPLPPDSRSTVLAQLSGKMPPHDKKDNRQQWEQKITQQKQLPKESDRESSL